VTHEPEDRNYVDRVFWLKDGEIEIETRSETSPALKAHKGNELATARALQALANVTADTETAKLAKADADYFFAKH